MASVVVLKVLDAPAKKPASKTLLVYPTTYGSFGSVTICLKVSQYCSTASCISASPNLILFTSIVFDFNWLMIVIPVRIRDVCRRLWNFQKSYNNVRSSPRAIISHDILRLSPYFLRLTEGELVCAYCLLVK